MFVCSHVVFSFSHLFYSFCLFFAHRQAAKSAVPVYTRKRTRGISSYLKMVVVYLCVYGCVWVGVLGCGGVGVSVCGCKCTRVRLRASVSAIVVFIHTRVCMHVCVSESRHTFVTNYLCACVCNKTSVCGNVDRSYWLDCLGHDAPRGCWYFFVFPHGLVCVWSYTHFTYTHVTYTHVTYTPTH